MEEHNHKIQLHQDDFDDNSKKVKGRKERKKENNIGEGVERINFKLYNKLGPTVWAVLLADKIG